MQIMIGLVVGLLVGWYISTFDDATATYYANIIRPFSQIFIRMIRMLIAPLLFGTLVAGIAGAGHFKDVGRMGVRAIIYFEVVTTLALFIGLAAVNILKPGVGVVLPAESTAPGVRGGGADVGPDPAAPGADLDHRGDGHRRHPADRGLQHRVRDRPRHGRREGPGR